MTLKSLQCGYTVNDASVVSNTPLFVIASSIAPRPVWLGKLYTVLLLANLLND